MLYPQGLRRRHTYPQVPPCRWPSRDRPRDPVYVGASRLRHGQEDAPCTQRPPRPPPRDTACDEEALHPEGMYGPSHWLDDSGVSTLLAPYLCDGWDLGDYARFADLSGTDARRLASLLPKEARDDRQNNAPRIVDLLRAASRVEGLTSRDTSSARLVATSGSASTRSSYRSRRSSHTPPPPSTTTAIRATSTGSRLPRSSAWARTRSLPMRCASSFGTDHRRGGGGHGGTDHLS
ncbi:Uncharacterised protein [Schaalia odontolytica]|uniref:Uncharacterized protein n=1 Tax=Schaalia odontolytica TaxID=1660 RepID=A0A2X0U367_9ACTO|nr:Uncharacterised protein [Schaalia odontolytica]